MLETLSQGFRTARERLRGVRRLTEENIGEALRDVRRSLLEADVDYQVVKDFLERVKERALGEAVTTRARDAQGRRLRATPGQHFVAICEDELTRLMGPVDPTLAPDREGRVSVLLVGLQGVGKTTAAAKLAGLLAREGRRPLLVAADVRRPAAVLQLQRLGEALGLPVHTGESGCEAPAICERAVVRAREEGHDALVIDTAGRLAIDEQLMAELQEIDRRVRPANTLLVCDALMGRDAVTVARGFAERLELDGLILTKLDGDARGGAALAVKAVTGVPIKYLSTGEALERIEAFRPEGLASRILGMGDVVGLVRDFEAAVEREQAERDAERLMSGRFGMDDLLAQLRTLQRMGPLAELLGKLPGMDALAERVDERELIKVEAMIQSMTRAERAAPERIDRSRAQRIARGSGRSVREVEELLARFLQMREVMSRLGKGGKLGGFGAIPGLPGGSAGPLAAGIGSRASRRAAAAARRRDKRKRKQSRRDRRRSRRR